MSWHFSVVSTLFSDCVDFWRQRKASDVKYGEFPCRNQNGEETTVPVSILVMDDNNNHHFCFAIVNKVVLTQSWCRHKAIGTRA